MKKRKLERIRHWKFAPNDSSLVVPVTRRELVRGTLVAGAALALVAGEAVVSHAAGDALPAFPHTVYIPKKGHLLRFADGTQVMAGKNSFLAGRTVTFDKFYAPNDGTYPATDVLLVAPADGITINNLVIAPGGQDIVLILPALVETTVATAFTLRENRGYPNPDDCAPRPDRLVIPMGDSLLFYMHTFAAVQIITNT